MYPKSRLDELLLAAGYVERQDDGFILSKKGEEQGGSYLSHVKFGKYIAWPENLVLPNKTISQVKEYLNATSLGSKYNFSAQKINMMLSEIGWIERYLKGWTITSLGKKNGGIQNENKKSGIPFVEWPVSILDIPFHASFVSFYTIYK